MALDRPRAASEHFETAIKLAPDVAEYHRWLGDALGALGDSTSKIKLPFLARRIRSEFEKTVDLDPASIDGRHGLIQFYLQAPGVMGGSVDKAREQAREIIKLNPMRGYFELAAIATHEKRTADAEKAYQDAAQAAPDSLTAQLTLGSWYQSQQKWTDAFALYDRTLKKWPNDMTTHFQVGRTAALSGEQLERGEKELKYWIANMPKDAARNTQGGAHHRLGMIYEKQGRKDAARSEYQQALAIDPTNENARKSLAAIR
jgi:tetratricopeptide (TPR) repeat protein